MIALEEKKDRLTSALITALIIGLLFLVLIFFKIITPLPPFPQTGGNEGEELNFGIYNEGTGNVEGPGIGEITSVVVENHSPAKAQESNTADENFKNGEAVLDANNEKPTIKNNTTVVTTNKPEKEVKKEEDKSASNLMNAYLKNKNKSGQTGGDGNSGNAGNEGVPDGNPNTNGNSGHGNNPNGTGVSLSGRKILVPPPKVSDSKEEGIVVVNIAVDKNGNVTEADPTGKGTTTSSAILKSKARQAALQAKFTPSDQYDSQKGSVIFKFQF